MRNRSVPFLSLVFFCGCWALAEGPAGNKALRILTDYRGEVERPSVIPQREAPRRVDSGKPTPPTRVECTLERSVELAQSGNRDFLSRREDLYIQAMSLAATRYSWDPQISTTLSYVLDDTSRSGSRGASSGTLSGAVSQRFPWGGSATLSGSSTAYQHHADKADRSAASSIDLTVEQPLLRGLGPSVAMESLVQARRNLVYELRRFELYRQDFAIRTMSRFFNLVRLMDVLENSKRNFETFEHQYRQAKALFEVDRVAEIDVFRAEREMELARNNLIVAEDSLAEGLDEFKVFLGLDTSVDLVIQTPAWITEARRILEVAESAERIPFSTQECTRAGLANRLDLKNVEGALDDAKRAVSVAGNDLFPELDLTLQLGLDHDPVQDYEETNFDAHVSAALKFGIPWDFRPERDAFFLARIAQERAVRAYALMKEQIRQEVRERVRAANQVRLTIYIQTKIRSSALKRLRIAEYRFREGEIRNRDVVEAQEALLQAENRYIQALTDRRIRDLELAKAMGILRVGPGGLPVIPGWQELEAEERPEEDKGKGKGKEGGDAGKKGPDEEKGND